MGRKTLFYTTILAFALVACSGKNNGFRNQYRWLSGKWIGKDGDRTIIENWKWEKFRFEGKGVELEHGDTVFQEKLFLENFAGKAGYVVVMPKRNPIMFHQIEDDQNRLVFVNEFNDFPARIIYSQESDTSLTVSLMAKGRPNEAEISYQLRRAK